MLNLRFVTSRFTFSLTTAEGSAVKGSKGLMAKDWIEKLADDIKTREHKPAEEFMKEQRRIEVISRKGRLYYDELFKALTADITELNQALKGDVTAFRITITATPGGPGSNVIGIARDNFPRVQASLAYTRDHISASGLIRNGQDMGRTFSFHLGEGEGVSVREAFGEDAKHFNHPTEFAKYIMELLFTPA
jgi:hypothetical protein